MPDAGGVLVAHHVAGRHADGQQGSQPECESRGLGSPVSGRHAQPERHAQPDEQPAPSPTSARSPGRQRQPERQHQPGQ